MKIYLLFFLTFISLSCLSQTPRVYQTEARFIEKPVPFIKVVESKFPSTARIDRINFLDEKTIVFISIKVIKPGEFEYSFHKTNDAGKTWQISEINFPKDSYPYDMLFITPSTGWLTLGDNHHPWDEKNKALLMKTSDGGKSWKILRTESQTTFDEISFTDERNGWMIANKTTLEPSAVTRPLIYRTKDGGETWHDTSEKLRAFYNYTDGAGTIIELLVESPEKVVVATHDRKFFRTEDGGKTWQKFGPDLDFFPAQIGISNLGKVTNTDRLRIAAGSWTIEGHNAYVASEEKDGTWKLRWIREGINLSGILYLSEKEVLISGTHQKSLFKEDWEKRTGVIYYSSDGGDTFSTVYQTPLSRLGRLIKLSDNRIIVLGENGLLVNLEIQKNR